MTTPIVDKDLVERLILEAQCHAQEARTANATIAEIYQLVTGTTGEPGNWHGAEPVRAYIAEQRKLMEQARDAMEGFRALVRGEAPSLITYDGGADAENFDIALAALRSRVDGADGALAQPSTAHSKSEYKRRVALGDTNIQPPGEKI